MKNNFLKCGKQGQNMGTKPDNFGLYAPDHVLLTSFARGSGNHFAIRKAYTPVPKREEA
jgi:hypothetical protein